MTFLEKTCEYLLENHRDLVNICVLVPSRRAMRSLRLEFRRRKIPNEQMPTVYPIEDFVSRNYEKSDLIEQLLLLQKTAYEILQKPVQSQQPSDNLLSWLPILLKDFNLIDQNLVDAQQLFQNLADIERIKEWELEETRKKYVQDKLKYYFEFWDKLYEIYKQFKQNLEEQNLAYLGMVYRKLAENIQLWLKNGYEHYYFVGFNAFSRAEEKIIDQLLAMQKATLLWDTDDFYMEHKGENQAGKWLKRYKQKWQNWLWQENLLLSQPKKVEIIATGSYSLQAQVAQNILNRWDKETRSRKRTVIVMPDENMLLPLLHAISEKNYNITLGLSLQKSTLFNLIALLFELQQTRKEHKWKAKNKDGNLVEKHTFVYNYSNVAKILTHPFIRKLEQVLLQKYQLPAHQSFLRSARRYLVQYNKVLNKSWELKKLPETLLKNEPNEAVKASLQPFYAQMQILFTLLFTSWNLQKVPSILRHFERIVLFFERIFENLQDDLEQFYIKKFRRIFSRMRKILKKRNFNIDFRTFRNFLFQLVRDERIPFESSVDNRLQIMGVLETRTLDFEQVIVVAANEGTFPTVQKNKSLIPYDIAKHFDLPTYEDYEAMHSYYFYRLLQRAEKVALIYCTSKNISVVGNSEVSRYAWQLEYDLAQKNPKISVHKTNVSFPAIPKKQHDDLVIEKNEEILKIIQEKLQTQLSPTAIDSFIRCSLQYYFNYVAGIKEAKEVRDEIEADTLGSIVHHVLEDIFFEVGENHRVSAKDLRKVLPQVPERVKQKFKDTAHLYTQEAIIGNNLIAQEVAILYVEKFLEKQIAELESDDQQLEENPVFEILSLENKHELLRVEPAIFHFRHNGTELQVRLRGIVDRVDKTGGILRIIDYKTGKVEKNDVKVDYNDLLVIADSPDMGKIRQLWIYKYLLFKNLENNPQWKNYRDYFVEAGIYSLRNPTKELLALHSPPKKEKDKNKNQTAIIEELKLNDRQWFYEKTENWLTQVVRKILDKDIPFQKTDNLAVCEFCIYKNICGRG
ncbi:MAG: PD-(D/E)XK nuclease family protein [Raineya sp.]|nr:PD-(D/E)XK nuclease family protein [Raineya sp.]MDW8295247.1 PD-(D/E)XK nuclease family protein [Raineya sp.]